jgi:hypothetical protein
LARVEGESHMFVTYQSLSADLSDVAFGGIWVEHGWGNDDGTRR